MAPARSQPVRRASAKVIGAFVVTLVRLVRLVRLVTLVNLVGNLDEPRTENLRMWRILLLVLLVLSSATPVARAEKSELEGVVNLNTASPDELGLIPGVGPSRIRNILAYRKLHAFRTVDELARIKGIGRKTIRRWRQHLAVSGPSTAQKVVRPTIAFVGPPAPATASPTAPKAASASPPPRPFRTGIRRGEPTHALFHRAPGNACLPPP